MDSSRVTVQGDGIRQVAVNRQSYFRVNTQAAGDADLSVRVTCKLDATDGAASRAARDCTENVDDAILWEEGIVNDTRL